MIYSLVFWIKATSHLHNLNCSKLSIQNHVYIALIGLFVWVSNTHRTQKWLTVTKLNKDICSFASQREMLGFTLAKIILGWRQLTID